MALPPDHDRCEFRYADDRRCCEFRFTDGARFCYTHQEAADRAALREKESRSAKETLCELVSEDLFDSATSVTRLLREVFRLSLEGVITTREAAVYIQMIRLLYKAAPALAEEDHPLTPEELAQLAALKSLSPPPQRVPVHPPEPSAPSARSCGKQAPAPAAPPRNGKKTPATPSAPASPPQSPFEEPGLRVSASPTPPAPASPRAPALHSPRAARVPAG